MTFFQPAKREQLKLRLAIAGPSGSGKTYSALRIASGLLGENGRIAVIDTEDKSASLYSDKFDFETGSLRPPYAPERFIETLKMAENGGFDCVIIDTISHAWSGEGGILDIHGKSSVTNSFAAWKSISPRHNRLFEAILQSPIHVIVTMRSKQSYALQVNGQGKNVPVKVGLAPVQRDDVEYEFTVALAMDINNQAHSTKDRTSLFPADFCFLPTEETGVVLKDWLAKGVPSESANIKDCLKSISNCESLDDLQAVFGVIVSNRINYSKKDMLNIIQAKDAKKDALSRQSPPSSAAEPDPPPQAPPTPTSKEQEIHQSWPSESTSETPELKMSKIIAELDDMIVSEEYTDAVKNNIAKGIFKIEDIRQVIKSGDEEKAQTYIDLLERTK